MEGPPSSEIDALRATPAEDLRDARGRRQGVWNVGPEPHPEARTTYVDGVPCGPFYWPSAEGDWFEGVLEPLAEPSDDLSSWARLDADRRTLAGYGPSVDVLLRSFTREGWCDREARRDGAGRLDGATRRWDASGALVQLESHRAGVPHGPWGHQRGKKWVEWTLEGGRVVLSEAAAAKLGGSLSDVARKYADPLRLEQALTREVGQHALLGRVLFALVRAGRLDPFAAEPILMALPSWEGVEPEDVDALLADPRPFPVGADGLLLLKGWPQSMDRLVARALFRRPLDQWVRRARELRDPARRAGVLLVASRFGAHLEPADVEEVALALVDASELPWDLALIAAPGPAEDGLTLRPFRGSVRAEELARFGL